MSTKNQARQWHTGHKHTTRYDKQIALENWQRPVSLVLCQFSLAHKN